MRKQSIISSRLVAILAALAVALVAVAVILSKCEGTAVVEEKSDHVEVTPATIASIKSIGQWEFLTIHDEEYVDTVREGFFSDPIHGGNKGMVGWTLINFPGARADFMDWVERGERYPFPPVSINGERA